MATQPVIQTEAREGIAALIDAPRSFSVNPDISYIGGTHTVWKLRCYGRGISSIGEGGAKTLSSQAVAEAHGQAWVKTGVEPCYQTLRGVSLVSA